MLAIGASEWGKGVASSIRPANEVREALRWDDRWRYKCGPHRAHDVLGEDLDPLVHSETVMSVFGLDALFTLALDHTVPDYLARLLDSKGWTLLHAGRFVYREPITFWRLAHCLWAIKYELRSSKVFGSERLVLTDSMCVSLAISKGRAHDHKLLTVIRRISATCLTGALRLKVQILEGSARETCFGHLLRHALLLDTLGMDTVCSVLPLWSPPFFFWGRGEIEILGFSR